MKKLGNRAFRAVFVSEDGETLKGVRCRWYQHIYSEAHVTVTPEAAARLRRLEKAGYRLAGYWDGPQYATTFLGPYVTRGEGCPHCTAGDERLALEVSPYHLEVGPKGEPWPCLDYPAPSDEGETPLAWDD